MDALGFLAIVATLGAVCFKIVEFIGTLVNLSGNWVRLVALIVGSGLAAAFNLDPAAYLADTVGATPADWLLSVDFLIGGIAIASAAGYLADRSGRSASNKGADSTVGGQPVSVTHVVN